ncbi:MAG: response regulator transcription factor [Hylemonella sp.]|nr:response regulator transcription factor [Hylemonella sp.]
MIRGQRTAPNDSTVGIMPNPRHLQRALIVEDLDEPRQWLAELLPEALTGIVHVDTAASLASARALTQHNSYDLALVDWGLPDGTGESLIHDLAVARPDAEVIVATIHDDDAHVFPALRAGATGYILKSQPRAVVMAQLQGIERGEPALSPSVALRVLKHFHALPQASRAPSAPDLVANLNGITSVSTGSTGNPLSQREIDVLRLIGKGYSAPEAGRLLGISSHTASSYVRDIYRKLGISSRAEAAMEAVRRGLVT